MPPRSAPAREKHGRSKGNGGERKAETTERRRTRRSPEEARALILEAAERVFATHLPDVVGLKEVAHEAGVSHALVTHYFGTYSALVEATLERRFFKLRDELVPAVMELVAGEADPIAVVSAHRRAIAKAASDPATVRLVTWALLSGRTAADDFFPHRMQGLKLLVDVLQARSRAPRADLEFVLFASFGLTTMWTLGRRAFAGALGHKPTRELEDAFESRIDAMLETFLRSAERRER